MSPVTDTPVALRWDPPGPSSWSLAADHYPRPVTAAVAADLNVWGEATTAYLHDLGVPIAVARMEAVHGLPYVAMIPHGRPGAVPPPDWILRLAVRVVPSLRRAERRLAEVLRDCPWNEGAVLTAWPAGLLRRAMLAAGARLVEHGVLDDADLAIEATTDEVRSALGGAACLDQADLERRRARRRSLRAADAPRTPGPPAQGLPGALGTVMRAIALASPSVEGPNPSGRPG
jgi:hypothetical protein